MHYKSTRKKVKFLIIAVLSMFFISNFSPLFSGDIPVETGVLQKTGDNFVSIVIKGGKGFKDGTKLTFYLHPKTKIIMSGSEAPLVLDSLLVGDMIQITLGPVEKAKDGSIKRMADKIVVLSTRRPKPKKGK